MSNGMMMVNDERTRKWKEETVDGFKAISEHLLQINDLLSKHRALRQIFKSADPLPRHFYSSNCNNLCVIAQILKIH